MPARALEEQLQGLRHGQIANRKQTTANTQQPADNNQDTTAGAAWLLSQSFELKKYS
jgi:hypothetical protein